MKFKLFNLKESLNQVTITHLEFDQGLWYLKWSRPEKPNGIIYKYNLRFVDSLSNKTQGPFCHPFVDQLRVPLKQFLLAEGREYIVQVQAVSTVGYGLWSSLSLKYRVPIISHSCKFS